MKSIDAARYLLLQIRPVIVPQRMERLWSKRLWLVVGGVWMFLTLWDYDRGLPVQLSVHKVWFAWTCAR